MKRGIILSAGDLPNSMTSEIGLIPPIFLPIGGRFLINEQVKYLDVDKVLVTLPEEFSPSEYQVKCMNDMQVKTVLSKSTASVLESLEIALSYSNLEPDDQLHILMGDTLFSKLKGSLPDEFYTVDTKTNDYNFTKIGKDEQVFTGHIKLSGNRSNMEIIETVRQILNGRYLGEIQPIFPEKWYNLGHFNDFFQSKIKFVTSRHFNSLSISNYTTTKKSMNKDKLKSEIRWYKGLPSELLPYASQLYAFELSSDLGEYTISTNHGHLLSDLHVFYNVSDFNWKVIYNEIECYLREVVKYKIKDESTQNEIFDNFFTNKTNSRILEYKENCPVDPDKPLKINSKIYPSINSMIEKIESKKTFLSKSAFECTQYIHGDLCFSNIFFDFRSKKLALIDPRGIDPVLSTATGPLLYELVKLAHSALFNYDYVIHGWYELVINAENCYDFKIYNSRRKIHCLLVTQILNSLSLKEIDLLYGVFHLFVSMVPLHAEDGSKQRVLIGIACEIFDKIEANKFD